MVDFRDDDLDDEFPLGDGSAETEATVLCPYCGEPNEIAGAAVFLASKAGAYVTGQGIVVDGGTTIRGGL